VRQFYHLPLQSHGRLKYFYLYLESSTKFGFISSRIVLVFCGRCHPGALEGKIGCRRTDIICADSPSSVNHDRRGVQHLFRHIRIAWWILFRPEFTLQEQLFVNASVSKSDLRQPIEGIKTVFNVLGTYFNLSCFLETFST